MERAELAGLGPVARLIMGSAAFGNMLPEDVMRLLDAYVESGGNALETAHDYGNGKAEALIGEWVASRGARDRVLLFTKGAQHDQQSLARRVTPEAIERDLLESLERLRVDTVDLLVLHRDDPDAPVGPIVECLNEQLRAGRIRAFGGSNWSHPRIDEANRYAAERGLCGFAVSSANLALAVPTQPLWHEVISIAGDAEAREWYRRTQTPLMPWSSQARGFFAGPFGADDPRAAEIARVYDREDNWERLRRAKHLAEQRDSTPTRAALAWVLRQPFPTFPLVGPRTVAEWHDCLGALDLPLSPEESAWLNLER